MTKKNTPPAKTPSETESAPEQKPHEETPFEAAASICSVLVVGLFILTFLAQNFVIPSGSMEQTLLVGDHLVVDRVTLAPPTKWMPLVHYREPKRGDIVVFIKPGELIDADGKPTILFLVKRLVGVPGDHIHLHNGIVIVNGVAQSAAARRADHAGELSRVSRRIPFRAAGWQWRPDTGTPERWAVDIPESRRGWRSGGSAWEVLHDGRQSPRQPRLALLGLCAARKHRGTAAVQLLVVRDTGASV